MLKLADYTLSNPENDCACIADGNIDKEDIEDVEINETQGFTWPNENPDNSVKPYVEVQIGDCFVRL